MKIVYNCCQIVTHGEQFMKITWKDYRKIGQRFVTQSAFYELNTISGYKPTFTTADEDHDDLISFSKLFLSYYKDPSEQQFVEDVFEGDWRHWKNFKESSVAGEIYKTLRQQADEMLVGDAMKKVLDIAFDDNNKNNLQALKFIIDGKTSKVKEKVGRPKKEKKEPEINSKDLLADIQRLKQ